jgi:hypothetical protein
VPDAASRALILFGALSPQQAPVMSMRSVTIRCCAACRSRRSWRRPAASRACRAKPLWAGAASAIPSGWPRRTARGPSTSATAGRTRGSGCASGDADTPARPILREDRRPTHALRGSPAGAGQVRHADLSFVAESGCRRLKGDERPTADRHRRTGAPVAHIGRPFWTWRPGRCQHLRDKGHKYASKMNILLGLGSRWSSGTCGRGHPPPDVEPGGRGCSTSSSP